MTFSTNEKAPLFYDFFFLQDNGLDFLQGREQFTTDRLEGVDAQLYSETALTVNGQDKGSVTSLLFREELYLPVNNVAGLMGKGGPGPGNGRRSPNRGGFSFPDEESSGGTDGGLGSPHFLL